MRRQQDDLSCLDCEKACIVTRIMSCPFARDLRPRCSLSLGSVFLPSSVICLGMALTPGQAAPGKNLGQLLALCRCQLQAVAVAITWALSCAQGGLLSRLALIMLFLSFRLSFGGCLLICSRSGQLCATYGLLVR